MDGSIQLIPLPKIHRPEHRRPGELKGLIQSLIDEYPIPAFSFSYGTAGFRYEHSLLPAVFIRMGVFAVLRSVFTKEQVGIMVTASHNKEVDNGIKMADPDGGMLAPDWENLAVRLVNALSAQEFLDILESLYRECELQSPFEPSVHDSVVIHFGRDTRSHSEFLSSLCIRASLLMGATVYDHGLLSTPQLHYIVMHSNPLRLPNCIPYAGWERGYYETLVGAFVALKTSSQLYRHQSSTNDPTRYLYVDCACGVGADKVLLMNQHLQYFRLEGNYLNLPTLVALNKPGEGPLNDNCGAEYVQKNQCFPTLYSNMTPTPDLSLASLDGDADRIVFTYRSIDGSFRLLDGDKIAVLVSSFIQEEILALSQCLTSASSLRCGVVQTAYANGASTHYLKNTVHTTVEVAKTGVKYVHEKAHSNFDIGTYFEANGHGTVVFGRKFYCLLAQAEQDLLDESYEHNSTWSRSLVAWQRLRILPRLINQAVGDALSDLLLVDAILSLKELTLEHWDSLYQDLPSRQLKIRVADRKYVETNEDETKVTSPLSLQLAIDATLSSFQHENLNNSVPVRAFVRPSGTEDVVRIYAEASTQKDADNLAFQVSLLVYDLCHGVGEGPVLLLS